MSIKDNIRYILTIKGSPHSIAIAFSVGVFIGMSPLLGLHTVLALAVASLLGLNRMVTLAGTYITNPWTIVPIYSFSTWFGVKITGYDDLIPDIDFHSINILNIFKTLKSLIVPFVVGTTVVSLFSALLSYLLIYQLITRVRR